MSLFSREERIQQLKDIINSFQDSDFGQPLSVQNPEHIPEITPPKGVHPRLYLTKKRLEEIRAGLHAEENKYAYEKFIWLSESNCDGVVTDFESEESVSHYRVHDTNILTCIHAKAFRYALTGDTLYGYAAVAALKAYLKHPFPSFCREQQ